MVAVFFVGLLLTDRSMLCLSAFLAAAFHEAGHLLAARLLRIPIRTLRLDLLGARMDTVGRLLGYGEEWLLCAAGPLFSLLLSCGLSFLWDQFAFTRLLSCASLLLGLLNLLPIRSFDGGRMLSVAVSATLGETAADYLLKLTSFLFLFLLWALSVYFLLRAGDGLSLFCFSMSLFSHFFAISDGD
ncbi:MAG: site-2 protease family protein [Clostridia bacterium]|nr:site-2 protease family protein [Clostridia bacterium]